MPKPTPDQLNSIALQLYGRKKAGKKSLPKCPGRDFKKVNDFEMNGNFDHSGPSHICGECQCTKVAGDGTTGEFWGQGEEWNKVGHYGVGYCREHEVVIINNGGNEFQVWEKAEVHRDALVERGIGAHKDPHAVAKEQAQVAERKLALVRNMENIGDLMNELMSHLEASKKLD